MYHKKKIDALYKQYIKEREREVLERLIEECYPIIDIVLTRYGKHARHFEDIRQEVKLRLWKNLRRRTSEDLGHYCKSPTTYLFFLIRNYSRRAFERLKNIYKEDIEVVLPKEEMAKLKRG